MTEAPAQIGRVVVIGASAGGVSALTDLVAALDPHLNAAVLVVLHLSPDARSALPAILGRTARLPVARPRDHEPLVTGNVYVAPPDHHLLVEGATMCVTRGPRENGHRPSVDALFRSAATSYGPRAIGVVLTGALDDGAAGLAHIAAAGGAALVQDPAEAEVASMPEHALAAVPDAMTCAVAGLARAINELAGAGPATVLQPSDKGERSDVDRVEARLARGEPWEPEASGATAAGLGCPDCGGSLFTVRDEALRYRCRVGHAWTAEALEASHAKSLEQALWTGLRVLEENREIDRRLEVRAGAQGRRRAVEQLDRRRHQREYLIAVLRAALQELGRTTDDEPDAEET